MGGILGDMRTEADILKERIEKDLVAFGHFSASDLFENCLFQEEFTNLEPGLFEGKNKKKNPQNLKEA